MLPSSVLDACSTHSLFCPEEEEGDGEAGVGGHVEQQVESFSPLYPCGFFSFVSSFYLNYSLDFCPLPRCVVEEAWG